MLLLTTLECILPTQTEPEVTKRQVGSRVRPILKYLIVDEQLIKLRRLVPWVAIPQRVMMGLLDNGDRIDLDIAEMFDRRQRRCRRRTRTIRWRESLRQQHQFSGLLDGE